MAMQWFTKIQIIWSSEENIYGITEYLMTYNDILYIASLVLLYVPPCIPEENGLKTYFYILCKSVWYFESSTSRKLYIFSICMFTRTNTTTTNKIIYVYLSISKFNAVLNYFVFVITFLLFLCCQAFYCSNKQVDIVL